MGKKEKSIPKFQNEIIETHCHLDYLKDQSPEEAIKEAGEYNVQKIITIAVSPSNLDSVIDIAKRNSNVYTTQGIHPHDAKDYNQEVEAKIRLNANSDNKVVAVGEIGLDYYYDNSPRKEQIEAFRSQMNIATDLDFPVVIHSRDAEEDTKTILDDFKDLQKQKGVIHSFTSKLDLAEEALNLGYYLGFNGIITFKNAHEVREAVKLAPIEKTLIETDSPFLTPDPFRGRPNTPKYLPLVAQKIAEIKDLDVEEVISITTQNAISLFFKP
ncbi:MAG: TatD family hydrolase [Bacteriovoracaceae bacterium]